jgi:hypothetical protein
VPHLHVRAPCVAHPSLLVARGARRGPIEYMGLDPRSRGRRAADCCGAEDLLHGTVLDPPPLNLHGPTSSVMGDSRSSLELCRHPVPLGAGAPPPRGGRWRGELKPPSSVAAGRPPPPNRGFPRARRGVRPRHWREA